MHNPLVSIIVITYNSAKYVLETLESAKNQTYQNIELIISDDGSKDDTVKICEKWLAQNKIRFVNSEIITVEKNTGIPANCNRGVNNAKGEWVKLIAGDDAFYIDAIEKFIDNSQDFTEYQIIQTNLSYFKNDFRQSSFISTSTPRSKFYELSPGLQHKVLLIRFIGFTPAIFFKASIIKNFDFDEQFRYMEDYPYLLKLTFNNIKINYIDVLTVKYRISENSVQNTANNHFMSSEKIISFIKMLKIYHGENLIIFYFRFIILINKLNLNQKNGFNRFVEMSFFKITNIILVKKYKL